MKKKMLNAVFLMCTFFSITTILSSTIQLLQQQSMDSNVHILLRGAVCIVAVVFIEVFRLIKLKNAILKVIVHYSVTMLLVFLMVYISGHFVELDKNAYRDIFLNYTAAFIVVSVIMFLYGKKKSKNTTL